MAERAMGAAFIPMFSKMHKGKKGEKKFSNKNPEKENFHLTKEEFYFTIFWLLAVVVIIIILLGINFSSYIASFLFILQKENNFLKIEETSLLLKILFPYIGFISLCSLQQSVLENHGRFAFSASVPVVFNLIIIVIVSVILWFDQGETLVHIAKKLGWGSIVIKHSEAREFSQTILVSLGVILGGGGQLAYSFIAVQKLGYRIFPFKSSNFIFRKSVYACFSHPSIKKFLFLLFPIFLSSGSYQIQLLLTEPIALSLGEGTISILFYATRLLEFPLGVVGVAITANSLPLLAKATSRKNNSTTSFIEKNSRFTELLKHSLNTAYLLFVPIGIVSLFYPETIVSIVFEFNRFTRSNVTDTAFCFIFLLPSLFSLVGYRIIFNAFYAKENTRTPLTISFISLFIGVPLAFFLSQAYPHPAMLALASTISSYLMLGASLYLLKKKFHLHLTGYLWERTRFFLKILAILLPIVYIVYRLIDPFFRVIEKNSDNLWITKSIYLGELIFFSLWVFGLYFVILFFYKEPQIMKILLKKKNKSN